MLGGACAGLVLATSPVASYAFDGCKVLLCFGGNWSAISDCAPDVHEALKYMSRSKCWPTCPNSNMSASWASSAVCPPQYGIYEYDVYGNPTMVGCTKTGVLDIASNGNPQWVRAWWVLGGDQPPVFEYSEEARAFIGPYINPQWDIDLETWIATLPPVPPLGSDQFGNQ
jgi:hypothetical protein